MEDKMIIDEVQETKNEEICQGCNKPISSCTGQFRICRDKADYQQENNIRRR